MFRRRFALSLLAVFTLAACADSAKRSEPEEVDLGGGVIDPADMMPPAPMVDMGMREIDPPSARELSIVGSDEVLTNYGGTVDLQVRYSDRQGGIPNARLQVRMLDETGNDRTATGIEGTGLRSSNAQTNANGQATFTVVTGNRNVTFRVEASDGIADGAPPVYWTVTVAREGSGGLTVRVTYDPTDKRYEFRDFSAAQVSLFDRENCDLLRESASNLQGAYFDLAPIAPFNEVDNGVTQGDLDDGATFSVAAVGKNRDGMPITFGCVDGVRITGGEITNVDVELDDLPLEWKGRFTVVHHFDLTDMLRNTGNETLDRVADVLEVLRLIGDDSGDRGEAIIELFCDLVNLDDSICRIVETIGGSFIDRALDRFLPQQVQDVFTVITDVLNIVSELTVVGEMEFVQSRLDENNMLIGNDNRWQKFRFVWRNGCPMGMDCRREFTIGNLDVERRPIFGVFDATVDRTTVNIAPHGLNFRYGVIILGIAEEWIIPAILGNANMGRVTFAELFASLLPCEDIDDITADGFCEDVLVLALSDILFDLTSRLEFSPDQFRIEGTATAVDEDGDLVVDKLDEGVWAGTLTFGETVIDFNGCFTGCRDAECPPPECMVPME